MYAGWIAAALVVGAPGEVFDAAELGATAVLLTRSAPAQAAEASAVLDVLAEWLRRRTDLSARSPEQAGLDRAALAACPAEGLFRCVAGVARRARAEWVFVVAVLAEGRTTVFALDAQDARPEDDEDAIYARAVVLRLERSSSVVEALDRALAAALDRAGHLDPFAELEVTVEGGGPALLELDGRALGALDGPVATVLRLGRGRRVVAASVEGRRVEREVQLEPRTRATVTLVVPRAEAPAYGLWGGGAALGLGAAALVVGAVEQSSRATAVCLRRAEGTCADAAPLGPPTAAAVEGASPWISVGVGATALGLSWLIGALLDPDDPWATWGLAVGAGAGAGAVVLSRAL